MVKTLRKRLKGLMPAFDIHSDLKIRLPVLQIQGFSMQIR
ncbi:hypothetical protein IFM89_001679 [Coptis chinensis]|uniref:Uncharacterized protein n=1 Tax=Coptis chinensis TaxID=261450 RepID=A0A835HKG7_9MAGN|nr:hypothetical protein IFM89_001679 [Coptis chinensis]